MKFVKTYSFFAAVLYGIFACPLAAQAHAGQELRNAFALEREGKTVEVIAMVEALLEGKCLSAPEAGKAWNILGLAYEDQGDFHQARRAYEHSIQILEKLPDNVRDYAMALDDLGGLYLATGDPEIAAKIKLKSFRLYAKTGDHTGMAIASSDLAGLALNQKRVHAARKFLEQAQREALLSNQLEDDNLAALFSMQGWLASMERDAALALTNHQRALDLWKRHHGDEHRLTGWGYILVGDAEANMGQIIVGLAHLEHGLQILERTLGRQNPRYMEAEIAYASVLDQTDAHAEAGRLKATAERQLQEFYRQQCGGCTITALALH